MKVNSEGLKIVKFYEGLLDGKPDTPGLDPYYDPIGIPTIGYGSIWDFNGDRITMQHRPITKKESEELLQREMHYVENSIGRLIKVPLTSNEFSAIASLAYNIGTGNLQASTLRRKLNQEDYQGAAEEFPKWRRAGGQILSGLVKRRREEQQLFIENDHAN